MKRVEVMKRASFVKQGSKMVFVCNVADLEPADAVRVIDYTKDVLKRMPKKSALALADLDNVAYSEEMEAHLQHMLEQCGPHVVKGACCGITDGRLKDVMECFVPSLGRNRKTFSSREEALSWLVAPGAE